MKIDLISIDFSPLDVTQWDLQVWVCVMLLTQAFGIFMWVRHQMKKDAPVERLVRDRRFGV